MAATGTTTEYEALASQISTYQQATIFFCLILSLALFLLLPQNINRYKRIMASVLVFIGMYGLFSIMLKTIINII